MLTALLAQTTTGNGGFALGGAFFLVAIVVSIACFAFWLWMLIDLLQSSKPTNEKILWAVVMVFVGVIGSLIYFLVARSSRTTA